MLGDLDKMLGNWKNKSSENLEQKFGGNFPKLFTWEISRQKKIPDIKEPKEPIKNHIFQLRFPFKGVTI
jgi:hypothetical protein